MGSSKRFRKVVCLSLSSDPQLTRALLSSIRRCVGIESYLILAVVTENADDVLAQALSIDFAETNISIQPAPRNFSERAWLAIERGFAKGEFVAYVDGDTVVTPDFLCYLEWGAHRCHEDSDIFLLNARGPDAQTQTHAAAAETARRPLQFGSAIGIWRNRWEWSKRSVHAKAPHYLAELDRLASRNRLEEIYPLLARCQRTNATVPLSTQLSAKSFSEYSPSVTAVMITGMHRERYAMARIAVECFKRQTYPNKTLLIVNHGEESLWSDDPLIRELRFKKNRWQTVGDLRNLALEHASGDFILNWDDDDWHHPLRMEVQMHARRPDSAVLLKSRIHHSLVNGCSRYAEYPNGAEATILHPRMVPFRYPSLLRGSDTVFAQQFPLRVPIENDPALHIRFFHGRNLWDAGHIMGHLAEPATQGVSELSLEHQTLLAQVLPLYGKRLIA